MHFGHGGLWLWLLLWRSWDLFCPRERSYIGAAGPNGAPDGDAVGAMFAKMERLNDLISASRDAWALAASIWDRIHWRYALLQRPNAWTLHVVRGHCVTMDGSEVFSQVSGSEFLRSYHVLATSPLVFLELSSRVPRHTVAI